MGAFSVWHWLILLFCLVIYVVPMWRIFSRLGAPAPLAILTIVPLLGWLVLWIVAFVEFRPAAPTSPTAVT